ncbi:MAG: ATP-binding protein [Planctomycetota bacterium]
MSVSAAAEVVPAEPIQVDAPAAVSPEELAALMTAFNDAASQLQHTQVALRSEVGRLKAELRDANVRLERSRRLAALGEMAAGIAHEVRNPLAAIALHAEMLRADLEGSGDPLAEQTETADKILRAARELDGVVGDVLRFARELSPGIDDADPAEPVHRAASTCRILAEPAGVELEVRSSAGEDASVRIDAGLIAQALINLVRNAIEAIADHGQPDSAGDRRVTLRVAMGTDAALGRVVSYAVEDTGPGVAAETLERMFNPFYTTRQAGCGLGLAMVQRIADAHGGRVDAASPDAGGAVFTLTVPAEPPRDAQHAEASGGLDP